jgi:transcriptional regulator with XRE-family HTH domain
MPDVKYKKLANTEANKSHIQSLLIERHMTLTEAARAMKVPRTCLLRFVERHFTKYDMSEAFLITRKKSLKEKARLFKYAKEKKLSLRALGEEIGIHYSTLARWRQDVIATIKKRKYTKASDLPTDVPKAAAKLKEEIVDKTVEKPKAKPKAHKKPVKPSVKINKTTVAKNKKAKPVAKKSKKQ